MLLNRSQSLRPLARLAASLALCAGTTAVVTGCENELAVHDLEPEHADDLDSELRLGPDDVSAFPIEGELAVSPVLSADVGANRVAVMTTSTSTGSLAAFARGVDGDGADAVTGPWVPVTWSFHEDALRSGYADLGTDEVWAAVQLGVAVEDHAALEALTFSAVFLDPEQETALDVVVPEETPQALAPELAFVGVEPRSSWGARPSRSCARDSRFTRMALHHTASRNSGNPAAMARQIQNYHMDGRGYCDAAYHFAVSQDGRVLELRPLPLRGGHTANNNTGNIGIVFMGCFDSACGSDRPTNALIDKGAGLVAMLHLLHGIPVDSNSVRGHRDHSGAQTACPGAFLYPRLEDIRRSAREKIAAVRNGSGGGGAGGGSTGGTTTTPPPAGPAPSGCGTLTANAQLLRGQQKTSCDGRLTLAHQGDGNVVVYDAARGGRAVWNTGTHGQATTTLVMQGDGNFVLYNGTRALWHSGTFGRPGASLAIQNDGNVVIYAPGPRAVWSTGTNR